MITPEKKAELRDRTICRSAFPVDHVFILRRDLIDLLDALDEASAPAQKSGLTIAPEPQPRQFWTED
jgi:hypothetical protein